MDHINFSNHKIKDAIESFMSLIDTDRALEGTVYGGWDERAVEATKGMGARFKFVVPMAGFIREAPQ